MFNKFELIGGGISVFLMGLGIYLTQVQTTFQDAADIGQSAQAVEADPGVVLVGQGETANPNHARGEAYVSAADSEGNIERLIIDDIKIGTGAAVEEGDTVAVHYIGTLQNGQEFDNSKKRGAPFEFTVGDGRVIEGWEQGIVGMQVGGQRVLVVPPDMAYGAAGAGPIPGNATLVFAIELLEIK